MEVKCSECKHSIDERNINVEKDTVYCSKCGNLEALSNLLTIKSRENFDTDQIIEGVDFFEEGLNWTIEASYRNKMLAVFLVPFTIIWAGGSLSKIYGIQIYSGDFDLRAIFFGLPFLAGSILLVWVTLMSLFGRFLIAVEDDAALLFTGVGSIGWYKQFSWSEVEEISEGREDGNSYLVLKDKRNIAVGVGLGSEKIHYILNVLRLKLVS